jgi:hypothetical protein
MGGGPPSHNCTQTKADLEYSDESACENLLHRIPE